MEFYPLQQNTGDLLDVKVVAFGVDVSVTGTLEDLLLWWTALEECGKSMVVFRMHIKPR